jgi:hypothetical protein
MKLSDIKEQLEKCAEVGVEIRMHDRDNMDTYYPWSYGIEIYNYPATTHNIHAPMTYAYKSLDDPIHRDVQAFIIDALEKFAEARGKYIEPLRYGNVYECVVNDSETDAQIAHGGRRFDTKLEACLAAFLSVDWSEDAA